MDAAAGVLEAVALHQPFGDDAGARHRGDDGEAGGQEGWRRGRPPRRCPAPAGERLARGVQPGVAEAGDDGGVGLHRRQHGLLCHAGGTEGVFEVAFDRLRPEARLHRPRSRCRGATGAAAAMPSVMGSGGVGIDQEKLHGPCRAPGWLGFAYKTGTRPQRASSAPGMDAAYRQAGDVRAHRPGADRLEQVQFGDVAAVAGIDLKIEGGRYCLVRPLGLRQRPARCA